MTQLHGKKYVKLFAKDTIDPHKRTRKLKALIFSQLKIEKATGDDALKKLFAEIESFSCFSNDAYKIDDGISDVVWKPAKAEPWPIIEKAKNGILFIFCRSFQRL